ncbi:uncharacterized protein [Amphiura filiformis]|uniref:uncharacterized protein n=1 Tax=Amphiura filiformis TaxID=82378 RepID=UPI003B2147A8
MQSLVSLWMVLQLIVCAMAFFDDEAALFEADDWDLSSSSVAEDEEQPLPCFEPNEGTWYDHLGRTNGGAGCGGCTCLNGHWHCSSCSNGELVCPRINCDDTCDSGHYEVRKDDYGCRYCKCLPKEYCDEFCELCLLLPALKCPASCHCV